MLALWGVRSRKGSSVPPPIPTDSLVAGKFRPCQGFPTSVPLWVCAEDAGVPMPGDRKEHEPSGSPHLVLLTLSCLSLSLRGLAIKEGRFKKCPRQ